MEESQERVRKAAKSSSNPTSPNWSHQGSREIRNQFRSVEATRKQSKCISQHSTSSNCSHRFLQSRDRAPRPLYQSARHADVYKSVITTKSCQTIPAKDWCKQMSNKGHDGYCRKQTKREEFYCTNQADQTRHGYVAHGYHKAYQDSEDVDRSGVIRLKYSIETLQPQGLPEPHAVRARHGASRSHKLVRNAGTYEGFRNQVDNEERCPGKEYLKPETKGAQSCKLRHGEFEGSDLRMSSHSTEESRNFEKKDGELLTCLETGFHNSKQRSKHSVSETIVDPAAIVDVGDSQRIMIPLGSASLQAKGENSVFAEVLGKIVQSTPSSCERNIMSRQDADNNSKEDVACFDTKKEYELLASLLLDDSLDIDQDFDIALAASGSVLPDSSYCGSIFGDDLELPAVSMDIESVAEVKTAISNANITMPAGHLPAICGFLEGDENRTLPKPVSGNDSLVESHLRLEDNDCRLAAKLKVSSNKAEAKTLSRVFVDVTNTFEIPDTPAVKGTEEDDAHRLSQRQRQVDFGKNTLGYERYIELVPRCKRKLRDPQTPNPKQVCSKRSWDGQVRKWRRLLHVYDPPHEHGEEEAENFSSDMSSLRKDVDITRSSQRFSQPKDLLTEDANLTIYSDWNEC
ncbi:hypothetical protein L7F22_042642 [Adiantum nelumboides]|nr:hypothetical protein [Adiantum nelumboides]